MPTASSGRSDAPIRPVDNHPQHRPDRLTAQLHVEDLKAVGARDSRRSGTDRRQPFRRHACRKTAPKNKEWAQAHSVPTYSKLPPINIAQRSMWRSGAGQVFLRPDRPAKASRRRVGLWQRRRDQVVAARGHQPGLDECPGFEGRRVTVGQVDHRIDIGSLPFESPCSTISCSRRRAVDDDRRFASDSSPVRPRHDPFLTSHQRMSPPLLLGAGTSSSRPNALVPSSCE